MAFMAAEIIRLVISSRKLRAPGKEFMLRLWVSLFLAISTIVLFRSFVPLITFFRDELVPHLRDSTLTIFNTQPILFLLLNSIIFAVVAPSGLFSDHHECSKPESIAPPSISTPDSMESVESSASSSSDSSGDIKQGDQELESMPASVERAEVSPPKVRVKRKSKSSLQKSSSTRHQSRSQNQISVQGIVEGNDQLLRCSKSARSRTDSLKDEDFKQLIDNYIAHAREKMIKQDDQA